MIYMFHIAATKLNLRIPSAFGLKLKTLPPTFCFAKADNEFQPLQFNSENGIDMIAFSDKEKSIFFFNLKYR
jgi:hypothetical protein